ncbi:DUF3987 domain-containing protein [Desulfovibrio sp. JC010]|uniref:DUF3987 domain-containing protein n=1 Tax=Desulfovibrio sp. JC010 TaxID=2593641 RepID=UPI0013D4178D|nr:DUF3987 domain-containing protein [Desulfovibrio sp. JC010]NDV27585.1 DUF3987 domain-containing protein [Desulfovibrio sp. JC010]
MNKKIETPTEMEVGKLDDLSKGNMYSSKLLECDADVNCSLLSDCEISGEFINDMSLHEAALFYAEQGYAVIPCYGKRPAIKGGYKKATINPDVINEWWGEKPDYNIGIATGDASGFFVLDIDGDVGEESIRKLEAENSPLPETHTIKTGGGGRHMWFKNPQGRIIGNRAGIVDKVDIRGNGGHAIAPPSLHESGNVYELVIDCEVAEAPEWLLDLIGSKTGTTNQSAELSVLEQSDVETTKYGQVALDNECEDLAQFKKKGNRNSKLYLSAIRMGQHIAGNELNYFEVYERLENVAIGIGLDADEIGPTIESGLGFGFSNPRRNDIVKFDEKPKPLGNAAQELPEVPISIFPEVMQSIVKGIAYSIQVPIELVLINFLACIALSIQNKIIIKVKSGYYEHINIYAAGVLPPGDRKSAVTGFFKYPFLHSEIEQSKQLKPEIEKVRITRSVLEKRIDLKMNQAAKTDDAEDRDRYIQEVVDLKEKLPEIPYVQRWFADDATPEALGELLQNNNESIGMIEAEGGFFGNLAGRYSKIPNIDGVLKYWSGEGHVIDRKKHDPIRLANPLMTMCLSVQPHVLDELYSNPHFVGRGLSARFICLIPKTIVGYRNSRVEGINPSVKRLYSQLVQRLMAIPIKTEEANRKSFYCIGLTPAAEDMYHDYHEKVEEALKEGGRLETVRDWASKLTGQLVRLAGILHCIATENPHENPILGETMEAACLLADVLGEHALAAHGLAEENKDFKCAHKILDRIKKDKICEFSERQMLEKIKGSFNSMKLIGKGIKVLLDRFYIKELPRNRTGRGRPPSAKYMVSPYITKDYGD